MQAADQQGGANHEHQRQSNLAGDQPGAKGDGGGSCPALSARLDHSQEVHSRGAEGRRNAERDPRHDRERRGEFKTGDNGIGSASICFGRRSSNQIPGGRLQSLTIWTATINGELKLRRILPDLRRVADQLVVGVDDASTDESARVAGEFADKVVSIPHEHYLHLDGNPNHVSAVELALPHFTGDWILRVDHDETLGPALSDKEHLRSLLSDRYTTHYWIPRRWVVPPGDRFISSCPWHGDTQVRLYRNLPSIIDFSKQVHRHTTLLGQGRALTHEWLVHWDLVWHSRAAREAKVRWCEGLSTYSGADYYLYEEQEYETLPLGYVPAQPLSSAMAEPLNDPLGCKLGLLEYPEKMIRSRDHTVLLSLQNLSPRVFYPPSVGLYRGNVLLSYHWYREQDDVSTLHIWDHPRSNMPKRLAPGESSSASHRVRAPSEPGLYWLQPDLVEETVAWTSFSMEIPKYRVEVL
ncbi:MAG: glycosyltransferase [Bryobacteraceae bacterium]|nr:glycosyltransferase [Bryobacteraceae bacterium]